MRDGDHNSGSTIPAAVKRRLTGQRCSNSNAAAPAMRYHHHAGSNRHNETPKSAAQTIDGQRLAYRKAASSNGSPSRAGQQAADTAPSSTTGTSTKEMTGIATRFTSSPARETPPNTAKVSGASASMTDSCSRSARRARESGTSVVVSRSRITPTATNDSQNPLDKGASTSARRTAISDSDQVRAALTWREPSLASTNTASMSQVRWVGTDTPASNA